MRYRFLECRYPYCNLTILGGGNWKYVSSVPGAVLEAGCQSQFKRACGFKQLFSLFYYVHISCVALYVFALCSRNAALKALFDTLGRPPHTSTVPLRGSPKEAIESYSRTPFSVHKPLAKIINGSHKHGLRPGAAKESTIENPSILQSFAIVGDM